MKKIINMNKIVLLFLLLFNYVCFAQVYPLDSSNDVDQNGSTDITISFYGPQPPPYTGFIGHKIVASNGILFHPNQVFYGTWIKSNLSFTSTTIEINFSSPKSERYYAFFDQVNQKYGWIYFIYNNNSLIPQYYSVSSDSIQVLGNGLEVFTNYSSYNTGRLLVTSSYQFLSHLQGYLVPENSQINLDSLLQSNHFTTYVSDYHQLCNLNYSTDYHGNPLNITKKYSWYVIGFPNDTSKAPILSHTDGFFNIPCNRSINVNFSQNYQGGKNYLITATFSGILENTDSAFIQLPNQIIPVALDSNYKKIQFLVEKQQTYTTFPILFKFSSCDTTRYFAIELLKKSSVLTVSNHRKASIYDQSQLEGIFLCPKNTGIKKVYYAWLEENEQMTYPLQTFALDSLDIVQSRHIVTANKPFFGTNFVHEKKYKLFIHCIPDSIIADTAYSISISSVPYYTHTQDSASNPFYFRLFASNADCYGSSTSIDDMDYDADSITDCAQIIQGSGHFPTSISYYFCPGNLEFSGKSSQIQIGSPFYANDTFIDYCLSGYPRELPVRKLDGIYWKYGWISSYNACFFNTSNAFVSVEDGLMKEILWLQPSKKIIFPIGFQTIKMYNTLGQLLHTEQVGLKNEYIIDLESGIYLLELDSGSQLLHKKIFVE